MQSNLHRPAAVAAVRSVDGKWSLTRIDVLLCGLPVALFLSIVSLV